MIPNHDINRIVVASGRRHCCCSCHDNADTVFVCFSISIVAIFIIYKWIVK